jgi:hypothetical protein
VRNAPGGENEDDRWTLSKRVQKLEARLIASDIQPMVIQIQYVSPDGSERLQLQFRAEGYNASTSRNSTSGG